MTGDVLFYAVMLVLPISALVARRLPIGEILKMALAWLAIFSFLFLVVEAWQEAAGVGAGVRQFLGG
ncbi:hypothetical protein BH10PSE15_BH10PSE15_08920 [soil metagenome]